MGVKILHLILFAGITAFLGVHPAYAGDGVTVVFKSGQVVRIDDGYRQVVDAMKALEGTELRHKIVELNLGGGSFLLDVADAVVVCRDRCDSLKILHQLDPRKGGAKTSINVEDNR